MSELSFFLLFKQEKDSFSRNLTDFISRVEFHLYLIICNLVKGQLIGTSEYLEGICKYTLF